MTGGNMTNTLNLKATIETEESENTLAHAPTSG